MQHAVLSVLFIIGLSCAVARYINKIVHRLAVDSPKTYDLSFWIQIIAVFYLVHVWKTYWSMGLLDTHWVIKSSLLFLNTALLFLVKMMMIEQAQTHIIRDLAIVNLMFISYVICYSVAGYPWMAYLLYLSFIGRQILSTHFVNQLSPSVHNTIGLVFNDPENLDELVRLNINDQLEGTGQEDLDNFY